MIVCDTRMGRGVPFLEAREKNHFIRVDAARMADWRSRRWTPGGQHEQQHRHQHYPSPVQPSRA